jgi:hypothetical protein
VKAALDLWFADGCRLEPAEYGDTVFALNDWLSDAYESRSSLFERPAGSRTPD